MEVRIGVLQSLKELSIEVDATVEEVAKAVDEAMASERQVVWFTDAKGRRIGIPSAKLAYVEIEVGSEARRVGFGPS